jgi:tetraacyldisaccharide 4'-kinase
MTLALAPLGMLYGAVARTRLHLYRSGFLKTENVGVPVISVGNITAGGTGKTPLVEWVARAVALEGRRACVLTRGYGRADEGRRVVVSDGERVLADVGESGDEPRLLAEQLLGVAAVVCDRNRVAAARWARANLGAEVFVLDDGFQHLRIARDLDIVTLDATAPWGGGHMLPRGRLREPREGLRRADCVVITRADQASDLEGLRGEAARLSGGRALVIASRVRTRGLRLLGGANEKHVGAKAELESAAERESAAAFCAIGNPRAFFEQLRREGFELRYTRAFPDHHDFKDSDLAAVVREAGQRGARLLLTTAKDAVKLRGREFPLPCYVVEIGLEFEEEGVLHGLVREAIM